MLANSAVTTSIRAVTVSVGKEQKETNRRADAMTKGDYYPDPGEEEEKEEAEPRWYPTGDYSWEEQQEELEYGYHGDEE